MKSCNKSDAFQMQFLSYFQLRLAVKTQWFWGEISRRWVWEHFQHFLILTSKIWPQNPWPTRILLTLRNSLWKTRGSPVSQFLLVSVDLSCDARSAPSSVSESLPMKKDDVHKQKLLCYHWKMTNPYKSRWSIISIHQPQSKPPFTSIKTKYTHKKCIRL